METPVVTLDEITLPAGTLRYLSDEIEKASDKHSSIRSLQKTGYQAGGAAHKAFDEGIDGPVLEIMQSIFWKYFCEFFSLRGWGTLVVNLDQPEVGFLTSSNWVEAMTDEMQRNTSCCFSTGFISGLLSKIAKSPIAVLETKCRSRGEEACEFAFGSKRVVRQLYGKLVADADLTTP